MYGWLWHRLPGPLLARLATVLVVVAGLVLLLFSVVYPALSPHLPFSNVTVDNGPSSTGTSSTGTSSSGAAGG